MKKKIFVVGNAEYYASFIDDYEIVKKMEDADIVLFIGGEDVNPALYGAEKHHTTWFNEERDDREVKIFKKIRKDQLAIGICRGSQFLCVMNGGKLVQNVDNHALMSTHGIRSDQNGLYMEITSTHHQMQYPYCIKRDYYDLLFVSQFNRSRKYEGDKITKIAIENIKNFGEPEIVLYKRPSNPVCLAIQGHPEMMNKNSITVRVLNDYINKIINKDYDFSEYNIGK